MTSEYRRFLESKAWTSPRTGLDDVPTLHDSMFEFQRDAVSWALRRGRACLFLECGLGKTLCQLEWARHVPGDVLILAPLAVSGQTVAEGNRFGIEASISRDGQKRGKITVTNYERIHRFDSSQYDGVVLDESSILKSHTGHYRTALIEAFRHTRFRLCCTATPAPNDIMELANHVEFMGLMQRQEFLATWFTHDGGDTSKWRLKKHAECGFWEWMATWSVMMRTPSDLGYDDNGFILPSLNMIEHRIETGITKEGELIPLPALNLHEQRAARRSTLDHRVALTADIVNATPGQWLVWCELNDESTALSRAIDGAVEVKGADDSEVKERRLLDFANGKERVLITKPRIGGFGLNLQNCHQQFFVGLSHSFEQTYQAIRRSWRFGQKSTVDVHVAITDIESEVTANVHRKQKEHETMSKNMVETMRDKSLEELRGIEREQAVYETKHEAGNGWDLYLGDSVEEMCNVDNDSVGLSVFSPPFASLYTYSASDRDMGNCKDYSKFMEHFGFLIKELMRATMPGRNCCVHCMDLPILKERDGFIGIRDFPGIIVRAFEEHGWYFHSRVVVWKDPVTAMQRTKAIGLLWKQLKKDSTMSRMGIPDYVITFRKPGENPKPVTHTPGDFPVDMWQKWASPVWMDINPSDTLQREGARENDDERHIAPLQLEVIRRCVRLWSNPGDLVLSPFAGIGSEGFVSVQEDRRFVGIELKESYFRRAVANMKAAWKQGDLFVAMGG